MRREFHAGLLLMASASYTLEVIVGRGRERSNAAKWEKVVEEPYRSLETALGVQQRLEYGRGISCRVRHP